MNENLLIVVAAALVDADGRVLVQRRPDGRDMAGLWEFPGGKWEPGEDFETSLIRELREELHIQTEAACLAPAVFGSAPHGEREILLLLYACRKWQGVPQAGEGQTLKWVFPRELHNLPMPPADRPMIGLLEALV